MAPGRDSPCEELINETKESFDIEVVQRLTTEVMVEHVVEEVAVVPLAGISPIFAMHKIFPYR